MIDLHEYGVSAKYGFLSIHRPLDNFSNAFYSPWDDLARRLPEFIKENSLERAIKDLPLLSTERLQTDLELQRAYVVLAFVIHGFVWSQSPPRANVPPQLSEPFLEVCSRLGMRPVISYAGLCIWNWQVSSNEAMPDEIDLESMEQVASFTGTRGEASFFHVPVLTEYVGGHLVGTFLEAINSAMHDEATTRTRVIDAFKDASTTFQKMGDQMPKMYPILDAGFFYHELRPFIGGGNNLPRGMVFQKSSGEEVEAKFAGGSAIQSSLFPFIDHVLGVTHGDQMLADMRQYMPGKHRQFLEKIEQFPTLRSYIEKHVDDLEVAEAYNDCMKVLKAWRRKHIAVVSKYIVQPARREAEKSALAAKARKDSPMESEDGELQGTGGTALIPFLRQAADETLGL